MFEARKLYRRILAPIALLLVVNVGAFAWVVWHQLNEDVVANLHGYAGGLDRMLVTILKESMRREDRETLRSAIHDFGDLEWVLGARILDKEGVIVFSSEPAEEGTRVSIASEICRDCHRHDPAPATTLAVIPDTDDDGSVLRAAETIRAESSCVDCHEVPLDTALGALVVDLDMGPLTTDARSRARRNLLFLVAGSVVLLGILIWVVRTVVVGRIHSLSDAVASLRAGQRVHAPDSPVDELDDLKETLAALGADLEGRQFAARLVRRADRALNGHGTPLLLADAEGQVLIANDETQAELDADLDQLAGRAYAELDGARADLLRRVGEVPLALDPAAREDRGPGGADRGLAALFDHDGEVVGYLEVGRRVAPPSDEDEAEQPAASRPMLPDTFLHGPYRTATATGDCFLRGALLLASLTRDSLRKEGVLELDPTLAHTVRTFERLVQFREVIDEQVDRCDLARIARTTANDFRRAHPGAARWHVLPAAPTTMVGHPVLLRQLVTFVLELAVESKPRDVVVFLQRQRTSPRFFFGVWTDAAGDALQQTVRWKACADLVRRFNGELELDAAYELDELRRVYGGRLPKLGRGTLILAEFPFTPG